MKFFDKDIEKVKIRPNIPKGNNPLLERYSDNLEVEDEFKIYSLEEFLEVIKDESNRTEHLS